jgi:hypothetical protein
MPTISIFFGIVVQMYWRDHTPPHGFEALVEIETGDIIRGRLPPAAATLVRNWVLSRRDALRNNWRRGRERLPFEKVPGADAE